MVERFFGASRQSLLLLLLVVLAFSVPFGYQPNLKGTIWYFAPELVLGLSFPLWLPSLSAIPRSVLLWISFLSVYALIAHDRTSLKEIVRWSEFGIALGIAIRALKPAALGFGLLARLAALTAVTAAFGLVVFLAGVQLAERPGAAAFFWHPNPLGAYLVLALFPTAGAALYTKDQREKTALVAAALIILAAIIATFSRGTWIALGGAFSLGAFMAHRRGLISSDKVLIAGLSAGVVFMCLSVVNQRTRYTRGVAPQPALDQRIDHIRAAIGFITPSRDAMNTSWGLAFAKRLFFGVGNADVARLMSGNDSSVRYESGAFLRGDFHNLYLQIFVCWGLIGLGIFAYVVYNLSAPALRCLWKDPMDDFFIPRLGLLLGHVAFLLNCFTGVFIVHGIQMQWAIIVGLLTVLTRSSVD